MYTCIYVYIHVYICISGIQRKKTMYFAKYLSISSLSITLFCKIKPNTINLTIIINATIGIK